MRKIHSLLALAASTLMTMPIESCSSPPEEAGSNTQIGVESESTERKAADTATLNHNGALSRVNVTCNAKTVFEKVKISAKCSKDDDKDGYPDSDASTIELENTTRKPLAVTFGSKLERYSTGLGIASQGTRVLNNHVSKPSINAILTTVEIQPGEVFTLDDDASSLDKTFIFDLSTEEVAYKASESDSFTVSCASDGDTAEKSIFGVHLYMTCATKSLNIHNRAKGEVGSDTVGYRGIRIKPNYPNLNITYIQPHLSPFEGSESILLFDNMGQNYEIEVSIPE
jgi:hypothetical protein